MVQRPNLANHSLAWHYASRVKLKQNQSIEQIDTTLGFRAAEGGLIGKKLKKQNNPIAKL